MYSSIMNKYILPGFKTNWMKLRSQVKLKQNIINIWILLMHMINQLKFLIIGQKGIQFVFVWEYLCVLVRTEKTSLCEFIFFWEEIPHWQSYPSKIYLRSALLGRQHELKQKNDEPNIITANAGNKWKIYIMYFGRDFCKLKEFNSI